MASDDPFVSALLVANGAPSVTGWQISGPRQDAWRLLDPDGSDEELWNRGASYLRFTFDGAAGAEPVISTPSRRHRAGQRRPVRSPGGARGSAR